MDRSAKTYLAINYELPDTGHITFIDASVNATFVFGILQEDIEEPSERQELIKTLCTIRLFRSHQQFNPVCAKCCLLPQYECMVKHVNRMGKFLFCDTKESQ